MGEPSKTMITRGSKKVSEKQQKIPEYRQEELILGFSNSNLLRQIYSKKKAHNDKYQEFLL